MSSLHKQIAIDDARPGMVLAAAVADERGMILLPADSILTEVTLRSLARRGIDQLHIVDHSRSEEEVAAELERRRRRLTSVFRKYAGSAGDDQLLLTSMLAYRVGASR